MTRILASSVQQPYEVVVANQDKQSSNHIDECFLCGRGLTASGVANGKMVHLATSGELIPVSEGWDVEDSQGAFPVGSECIKRVPVEFRIQVSS